MMKKMILFSVLIILGSMAFAAYTIEWYTIDGGGGTSSGGQYSVTGTIGQPDAGYHYESPYELISGFWVGGPLCIVDFEDFAQFAAYWLAESCDAGNNWCGGADINQQDDVNIDDLTRLASEWLDVCPYHWPLK